MAHVLHGEIIDGFHSKGANPEWKETTLPVDTELGTLQLRVHLNLMRRDVPPQEKEEWISKVRKLLRQQGKKGTQKEIAKALGMTREWVKGDVHTNSVENIWSLLKRSIVGSYHQVSKKHLDAYLDELEWRFNNRDNPYLFRDTLLRLVKPENLQYKQLTSQCRFT